MKHANNWTIFEHQKTLKNVLLLIRERERKRERERERESERIILESWKENLILVGLGRQFQNMFVKL